MESSLTIDRWSPPPEFDGFQLGQRIGSGGMGQVFLAHESALDRTVAIKFVSGATPGRAGAERFLIEARAIARLQHPNVVSIYRIGQVDGRPYIASEYVPGTSLERLAKPIAWPRALHIAIAVARGLAEAHRRGVLHRDVKPGNVIESDDGSVKLVDFGLAKLAEPGPLATSEPALQSCAVELPPSQRTTADACAELPWVENADLSGERDSGISRTLLASSALDSAEPGWRTVTGLVLGTPMFLAPELWSGAPATPRSDVYSAGLMLYELCAGSLPFAELDGAELVECVREHDLLSLAALRPDIPSAFAAAVDRCVRRDPDQRFASAVELEDALEAVHSVFSGFGRVSAATVEDDAALVAASFARLSARSDALVAAVYDELFRAHPGLRPLFPVDMEDMRSKLLMTIRLAVESLKTPERLRLLLEDLGRRHRDFGVAPKHMEAFGRVLLLCVERFEGPHWDERTKAAWSRAYEAMASAMRQGMTRAAAD